MYEVCTNCESFNKTQASSMRLSWIICMRPGFHVQTSAQHHSPGLHENLLYNLVVVVVREQQPAGPVHFPYGRLIVHRLVDTIPLLAEPNRSVSPVKASGYYDQGKRPHPLLVVLSCLLILSDCESPRRASTISLHPIVTGIDLRSCIFLYHCQ
jgi:hypothetical protein